MKILVVGQGAREHALVWAVRRDRPSAWVGVARGNAGTAALATNLPLDPMDVGAVAAWADAQDVDLVIVGPEAPLTAGLVDALAARGRAAFGPTAAAARIESSKAFAKELMARAGVPTAPYAVFCDLVAAEAYVDRHPEPLVVKASGLAAGKGAVVCSTRAEAREVLRAFLADGRLGEAGREVVVEAFLAGEELSLMALTDGRRVLPLLPAQDHKRVGEGDTGPNTGGMGAVAPVRLLDEPAVEEAVETILRPTLWALERAGAPFRGVLYAGLLRTEDGRLWVLEFNARFGDPEAEVVLPLAAFSWVDLFETIARGGTLREEPLPWRPETAVGTVLAAAGYPEAPRVGDVVTIPPELEADAQLMLFHAGTARRDDGALVTAGGRVLVAVGLGADVDEAATRSRAAAEAIAFAGKHFRRDIGARERARRHAGAA